MQFREGTRRILWGAAAPLTLIPTGHFSNLRPPAVSSLQNRTVSSLTTNLTGTRSNPDKYKTLTINSSSLSSVSKGAVYLWLDLLVANSGVISASGQNGNDGTYSGCFCGFAEAFGGAGAIGGAGGGGGAASTDLNNFGGNGGTTGNGQDGNLSGGCPTPAIPGMGGTGYANGGGVNYLGDASPFAYLTGGAGGNDNYCCGAVGGTPQSNGGYGGGGAGGAANGDGSGNPFAGGGAGGGGHPNTIVMRELQVTTYFRPGSFGGNGGNPSTCPSGNTGGAGAGAGTVQLFIAKVSTASLANIQVQVIGGSPGTDAFYSGENGHFAIYEVNMAGTILNTYLDTVPAVGWNHT